ncbi:MAG: flavodoxin [Clostridia bacterium]|nr:flavodoxin [Clostridia bacterium]
MKSAMLIHSLTGNTLSVADRLLESFRHNGVETELIRIEPIGGEDRNETNPGKIRFQTYKNVDDYDYVILGCPVRGFSMSPVLKSYLSSSGEMNNPKVLIFVTHFFPFSFMGGRSAINQLKKEVEKKGGSVVDRAVIDWKNPAREEQIERLIKKWNRTVK